MLGKGQGDREKGDKEKGDKERGEKGTRREVEKTECRYKNNLL